MTRNAWEELLVWTYEGRRFQERGIELRDLAALARLRGLVVDLARHVWKQRNPKRQRLSPRAAADLELRIFGFERGSCVARVHYSPPEPTQDQGALFEGIAGTAEDEDRRQLANALPEAAWLLSEALAQLHREQPISEDFPDELLPDLREVLNTVEKDAEVQVRIPHRRWPAAYDVMVPLAARSSSALATPLPPPSNDVSESLEDGLVLRTVRLDAAFVIKVDRVVAAKARVSRTVTGVVTMASLKGRAAIDVDGRDVRVRFSQEFEKEITLALHEHDSLRIRVRGEGEVDLKTGRLLSLDVQECKVLKRSDPNALSTPTFERWAVDDPERLIAVLRSGELKPTLLTFAAEVAGLRLPASEVVGPLLALLEHPDSAVREGAIYGLARHPGEHIDAALRSLAASDPSLGVREAAAATLEDR